jgi:hypothetical protein
MLHKVNFYISSAFLSKSFLRLIYMFMVHSSYSHAQLFRLLHLLHFLAEAETAQNQLDFSSRLRLVVIFVILSQFFYNQVQLSVAKIGFDY